MSRRRASIFFPFDRTPSQVYHTSHPQSKANAPIAAPATAINEPVSASPALVVAAGAAEPLEEAVPLDVAEEERPLDDRVAATVVAGVVVPLPDDPVPVTLLAEVEEATLVSFVVISDADVDSAEELFEVVVAVASAEEGVKQDR